MEIVLLFFQGVDDIGKWYENDIGKNILKSKYYQVGETEPQEFMNRVTSIFSSEVRENMHTYLENGSVCPAGRTLYAAGAKGKFKGSLSYCYILPSPSDDIESIFKVNAEIARIFSYGVKTWGRWLMIRSFQIPSCPCISNLERIDGTVPVSPLRSLI